MGGQTSCGGEHELDASIAEMAAYTGTCNNYQVISIQFMQ